ncbi:MAG: nucleoside deaminase [Hyphomicrobiales bacterium]|nr:nucleoside deaminase [Hyphomicrobiales bacterium]
MPSVEGAKSSAEETAAPPPPAGLTGDVAVATRMMRRCIEVSKTAAERGELPFAALVAHGDKIIVETTNRVRIDCDATRHAEAVAISAAQKKLGRTSLEGLTFYSNVEPCAFCSYAIRETRISTVYFALSSPVMGGFSRWNILDDAALSTRMPDVFAPPPRIVPFFLAAEADAALRRATPLVWTATRVRGLFRVEGVSVRRKAHKARPRLNWVFAALRTHLFDRFARGGR